MPEYAEIPDGYHAVMVILNDTEYRTIKRERAWTVEGTFSNALRKRAEMSECPWGWRKAQRDVERRA